MSEPEIIARLKRIERNQIKYEKRSSIAFGISIMVIAYNFLSEAIEALKISISANTIVLTIACSILLIMGFIIMVRGARVNRGQEGIE